MKMCEELRYIYGMVEDRTTIYVLFSGNINNPKEYFEILALHINRRQGYTANNIKNVRLNYQLQNGGYCHRFIPKQDIIILNR